MIKKELVMVSLEKNDHLMLARQLPLKSVALILAGGRGTRLKDLTNKRAKPAVHFGGKFRIIDFALSNCINSGIRRMGVITQYQSHTLVQHIQRGWSFFNEEMNEFVDLLPAQQRMKGENWYRGTADAVTQNLDIIRRYKAEYVVILAGDHIYKQDYSRMLIDHVEKGARCTVACMPVPIEEASAFGVMAVDENDKIIEFVEKPANPPSMPNDPSKSLASMGIYVFDADFGWMILIGLCAAIPGMIIAGPLWGNFISRYVELHIPDDISEPHLGEGKMPSFGFSLSLILLPLVLVGLKTIAARFVPEGSTAYEWFEFIGHPFTAILVACLVAIYGLAMRQGMPKDKVMEICGHALQPAGIILLVIGAGGLKCPEWSRKPGSIPDAVVAHARSRWSRPDTVREIRSRSGFYLPLPRSSREYQNGGSVHTGWLADNPNCHRRDAH
jgi:dTDP-glucose pyrophosphorylase